MNTIKIGVEAFIIKNNQLLLGKRKNVHGAGNWALPGGHVEFGEALEKALKREMREELGIEIEKSQLIAVTDDYRPKESQHYLHVSFLVEDFNGDIENKEPDRCEQWRYFPLSQLPENLYEPHRRIMQTYFKKELYLTWPREANNS